jgi:hypothetical protein
VRWRAPARKDANHREIVDGLLARGYTVLELHAVGGGVPDILVGGRGCNVLMEIKNPARRTKGDNAIKTLERQRKWRAAWRGPVVQIETLEQAVAAMELHAA